MFLSSSTDKETKGRASDAKGKMADGKTTKAADSKTTKAADSKTTKAGDGKTTKAADKTTKTPGKSTASAKDKKETGKSLWVSNLSSVTRAADLKTRFSQYGKVSSCGSQGNLNIYLNSSSHPFCQR